MGRKKGYYKGVYWTEVQEELCQKWLSATTEIEFTRIYNALIPEVKRMAEIVLKRYFSKDLLELKEDACNFLFIRLKDFKPEKGTAYNFCGMILKRYYYDRLVLRQERLFSMEGKVDYLDDIPENAIPVQYEVREFDYKRVVNYLKKEKFKLEKEYKAIMKYNPTREPVMVVRYIKYLDLTIEYVEKYEDFSPANIAEYIFTHTPVKTKDKSGIVYYFKKMLNINFGNRSGVDFQSGDGGIKTDDKYSYILDDYVPTECRFQRRGRIVDLKKKLDDYNLYEYF